MAARVSGHPAASAAPPPRVWATQHRVIVCMTSLVYTLLTYALGMAFVLGMWLVLILGSYLLWTGFNPAMSRWSTRDTAHARTGSERVKTGQFR
jgi:hypothetical protein